METKFFAIKHVRCEVRLPSGPWEFGVEPEPSGIWQPVARLTTSLHSLEVPLYYNPELSLRFGKDEVRMLIYDLDIAEGEPAARANAAASRVAEKAELCITPHPESVTTFDVVLSARLEPSRRMAAAGFREIPVKLYGLTHGFSHRSARLQLVAR